MSFSAHRSPILQRTRWHISGTREIHVYNYDGICLVFSRLVQLSRCLQKSNSNNKVVAARCPASLYFAVTGYQALWMRPVCTNADTIAHVPFRWRGMAKRGRGRGRGSKRKKRHVALKPNREPAILSSFCTAEDNPALCVNRTARGRLIFLLL